MLIHHGCHHCGRQVAEERRWDMDAFIHLLQRWLEEEGRLVEMHTGKTLRRVLWVRLDTRDNTVQEVLGHARQKAT